MNYRPRCRSAGDMGNIPMCNMIWPVLSERPYPADQYTNLAMHVREQLSQATRPLEAFISSPTNAEKMAMIVASVRDHPSRPLGEILDHLSPSVLEKDKLNPSIIEALLHAASLNAMVKLPELGTCNNFENEDRPTAGKDGHSLQEAVSSMFSTPTRRPEDQLIDHKLTMSYLSVYHKYDVIWVNDLTQHLQIDRSLRTIKIFQHKIWLSAHASIPGQSLLGDALVCEALDTLNLLFPQHDRRNHSFLNDRGQRFYSLGYCGRERNLHLQDYRYWGSNLEQLMDIMKEPRRGFWQLVPNARQLNILESANFWVAIFVACLAIISFAFGLVAVVYAKKSLDVSLESLELTRLQYQLSVAQACTDPDQAKRLPLFCKPSG
ncbi:hypothetical protein GQ607_016064 [Colletotrichum asianum]|uniref:Uncharacterized protein n=1 Tax=Colletotrichum asianum TaxID=702518 RepID=A0A8H3VZU4_9PEZI|nr:hypothetical protein GQ607_016064 [Colletotrichum asianum]